MTINRDIWEDRKKTRERIYDRSKHKETLGGNWLGHRELSGAAELDEMLLDGEFADRLMAITLHDGTVYRNFRNHRQHLWEAHGLRVVEDTSGKLMFDREDLEHEMPSREVRPQKRDRPKTTDRTLPESSGLTRSVPKKVQREVWIRNTGENMTFAIMLQVAERGEEIFYKPAVLYPWDEIELYRLRFPHDYL